MQNILVKQIRSKQVYKQSSDDTAVENEWRREEESDENENEND